MCVCVARALTFFEFFEAVTMQEPKVSSPENTIDVTSDGEEETVTKPQNRSHGGLRNTKCFGDKLMALEAHNIRDFLTERRCCCGEDCHLKLSFKGEEGERIVYDLRSQRFESECMHHRNNGTQQIH